MHSGMIGWYPVLGEENIMDIAQYKELIERHFRFLSNNEKYSMVRTLETSSFGNLLVEYQSQEIILRITLDKSQVIIDIKPKSSAGDSWFGLSSLVAGDSWFGLSSLVDYVAPELGGFKYVIPEKWNDYDVMIEQQVKYLGEVLRKHCGLILSGRFSNWKEVEEMREGKKGRE